LFLLYEAAGIAANLAGGYFASRFGIPRMLAIGQALQIAGLLMLSALDPGWGAVASVAWVVIAQGIAGVAKDLTKTASKSAIKATSADGSGQLFRWVAWFTGSKNAMKGIGFFIGGLLLDLAGFAPALWMMAALLGVIFVAGLLLLPSQLGKAKSSKTIRELFGKSRGVNLLAAARIFMFGARDVWFVVGLPVFLYANGWRFLEVGGFLAAWTVAYGGVQALAPMLVSRSPDGLSREVPAARMWAAVLAAVPIALAVGMQTTGVVRPDLILVIGLALFGLPFAVNSSLHSYLILAYAGSEKAAEDVGFYYAANAAGRLLGTALSGVLYQFAGITGCLVGSAVMLLACWLITFLLPTNPGLSPAHEQPA
ncbi:MAG: organoarsenical effux MFS transporter ArsJ, partial [Bradyrhizobium sp.]|nr:organoarsenical effux MFS transporter ArsJ [Bradyrhizobium sp.]